MTAKINRPAIRYHGSKWMLAPWIISHFPPHECYVEPYAGSASVLLRKPRSWLEVYNDKDQQIVNFFRTLRETPHELIRAIQFTPFAKQEWILSFTPDPDPVEQARRFYIRAFMSIAGPTAKWNTGWRRQKVISKANGKKKMTPAPITLMHTQHLYAVANRLRGVQIECDVATAIIERYDSPETLFYVDPPYPSSTRGRWSRHAYTHEMTDQQHRELATALQQIQGAAAISSYPSTLYDQLYIDWQRVDKTHRINGPGYATECLWLSPQLIENKHPLFRTPAAEVKT